MSSSRLSLDLRLTGLATAAAGAASAAPIACVMSGVSAPALLACSAALATAGAGAALLFAMRAALKPVETVRDDMLAVAGGLQQHEIFSRAQDSLDRNLAILREALYAAGPPRKVGEKLHFGAQVINDDFTAVDLVRDKAGGTATVFLGDVRISTNVAKPDGSRAVGTRLAAGQVHETVLKNACGFRGEAEILGESYFTIYDPIVAEGAVIGILYVGVKKSEFASKLAAAQVKTVDVVAGMAQAVAGFHTASAAQARAEAEAIRARLESEDVRRRQEMARQVADSGQRHVVAALSTALERLSDCDLSRDLDGGFPPEYLGLKQNFNGAVGELRRTMGGVTDGCRSMRSGAEEIRKAADDLARRTERQAATLEETAAALTQITTTVQRTADGADHASKLVTAARGAAERSSNVMGEAVQAMGAIQESSRQITQIIGVIDELAFQTSLLALNAGVEAARAGDSGRGFAVVASEVRTLAERSAQAAREIKALINTSSQQVSEGAAIVSQTGTVLTEIAGQVLDINTVVLEIAGSAREQARALDQVNTAVNDLDRVTQQNAAMVEQSTAASHALAGEADRLAKSVEVFRLSDDPARAAPAPASRRYAA